jgi:hypothetical protein
VVAATSVAAASTSIVFNSLMASGRARLDQHAPFISMWSAWQNHWQ